MSLELEKLRLCSLLHDIGKLECWADGKQWSDHPNYTYKFVKACFEEEAANLAMRHHTESFIPKNNHPTTDFERIINLANYLSGACRHREQDSQSLLPIKLTHILSESNIRSLEASELSETSKLLQTKIGSVANDFFEQPKVTYFKVFEILSSSNLRFIPADPEKNLNDIPLWDHSKLTAAFATCIWLSGGYRGDDLDNYKFALISGDTDRITSFVNKSRKLPDLRARSNTISDVSKKVGQLLSTLLGPECVLFEGGGSLLALAPPNLVQEALQGIEDFFQAETNREVSITLSHIVTEGSVFQEKFGMIWRKAQEKMSFEKSNRMFLPKVMLEEGIESCDVCRTRSWVGEHRNDRLCDVCSIYREKGKGVWLDDLKDENNFVACIKVDGDDVGRLLAGRRFVELGKENLPSRLSTLSYLLHTTCETVLKNTVYKSKGRCIFAGGDDLLAIVPGKQAFSAAKTINKSFHDEMAGKCTMSAGVAIFHYRLPIYAGLESAHILLNRAKETGKNRVAYAIIGNTGITLKELEEHVIPRKWGAFNELLDIVDFMSEGGVASSQLRSISELAAKNKSKADTYIKYLMGREVISWVDGEKFLTYVETGFLNDAFLIYNLLKGD